MHRFLTFAVLGALLLSIGCGDDDTAAECDSNDDCATGLCFTESTPGYCTTECTTEGSTEECPDDTVCKNIEGGPARCILVCETVDDCPSNSDCNPVPGSSLTACEPVR